MADTIPYTPPDSLPSADQAFGSSLPTADQAFPQEAPQQPSETHSGPVADWIFNTLRPLPQMMEAYGHSVNQTKDDYKPILPEADTWLKDHGVFNDYQNHNTSLLKSVNEAWMRPSIMALDAALRQGSEGISGIMGATGALGGELSKASRDILQNPNLAPVSKVGAIPLGMIGEPIAAIPEGFIPEGALVHPDITEARANNVIGVDNDTFLGTKEATPTQARIQSETIGNLGTTQPPDVHTVARQLAPDVFQEYDNLKAHQDILRQTLENLGQDRDINPRSAALNEQIQRYEPLEKQDRLTDTQQNRLDRARNELETTPEKTDSPEMTQLRQDIQEIDYRLRDLSPDVSRYNRYAAERVGTPVIPAQTSEEGTTLLGASEEPYDQAKSREAANATIRIEELKKQLKDLQDSVTTRHGEITYTPEASAQLVKLTQELKEATTASEKPVQGIQGEGGTQVTSSQEARPEAPQRPSYEAEKQEISRDVAGQLLAAGRPMDEAQAAGRLTASHYEARANRFQGKLGSPLELYRKEAPEIRQAGKREKGVSRTLGQEGTDFNKPTFFSTLTKNIREGQKKASAKEWGNLIENLKSKGVKQEELDWSGIKDFLKDRNPDEVISRSDLLKHLDDTKVELNEVQRRSLREQTSLPVRAAQLAQEVGKNWHELGSEEKQAFYDKAADEANAYKDAKFSGYRLKGGKDYRELLLTLPEKEANNPLSIDEQKDLDTLGRALNSSLTEEQRTRFNELQDRANNEENPNNFTSGHWDEKNVLAHIRFDTRIGPNGEKILHVAEIQSDWHQKGRKHGYDDPKAKAEAKTRFEAAEKKYKDIETEQDRLYKAFTDSNVELNKYRQEHQNWLEDPEQIKLKEAFYKAHAEFQQFMKTKPNVSNEYWDTRREWENVKYRAEGIPQAPFKSTWHELAMKRILRYAAENNFDKVSWDTGKTNADRYSLRKQIDELHSAKNADGGWAIRAYKEGNLTASWTSAEKELEDHVGKEIAQRVINHEGEDKLNDDGRPSGTKILRGVNLEVGGEGMKGFYDEILPRFVNKYVKKWGSKVEPSTLPDRSEKANLGDFTIDHGDVMDPNPHYRVLNRHTDEVLGTTTDYNEAHALVQRLAEEAADKVTPGVPVHSLDVTDKMKESVLEGQPLFQGRRGSLTLREGQKNIIKLFNSADASTFFHESGHQWLEDLVKDATHPEAPEELKQDANTVRAWLKNTGEPLTRRQHEQFARGFETYLMEGRAPNASLADIFQKFKVWLADIYKSVRNLKSPINDNIRNVLDRLVATPDEGTVLTPQEEAPAVRDNVRVIEENNDKASGAPQSQPIVSHSDGDKLPTSGQELVLGQGTGYVDKAGNIKLENLNTSEDVLQTIKDLALVDSSERAPRRGKLSPQDAIDLSDSAGVNPSEILLDKLEQMFLTNDISFSDGVLGLRKMIVQSAKNVMTVMHNGDEISYVEAVQRHLKIFDTLNAATRESGLALRAFRKGAEEAEKAQQLTEFLQANVGKNLEAVRAEMKRGRRLDTPAKVSGFVKDMSDPSLGEMALEVLINRYISGPITHTTYAISNKLFALYKAFPETLAKASVSGIHNIIDPVKAFDDTGVPTQTQFREVTSGLYAMIWGQKDGLKAAWEAFKSGQTVRLPGEDLAKTPFTQTKAVPNLFNTTIGGRNVSLLPLGTIARLPGERMVAPIHSFDRAVGYATNRAQIIMRQALAEGHTGSALNQRVAELEHNTPGPLTKEAQGLENRITNEARGEATEQALMGKPGSFTTKFIGWINWATSLPGIGRIQPLRFFEPFVSVSSNVNRLGLLDRSPLGLASTAIREDLSGQNGRYAQDTRIAKMSLGTAFMGATLGYTMMKLFNPGADRDYHKAVVQQKVNGLPHSLRIGDMSYAFDRMGVLGAQMSIAADMGEASKHVLDAKSEQDYKDAAVLLLHSVTEHFTDEGMMSGLSDAFKAIDNSGAYGESWINNFLATATVGVGSAQITKDTDPYQRDTHDIGALKELINTIKSRIPFEAEDLPAQIDLYGEPIPNKEYWGVYADHVTQDPAWIALDNNGYYPAPVERSVKGVRLNPQQYEEYARRAGVLAKTSMNFLVNMQGWSEMTPKVKHDLIKQAFTQARKSATDALQVQPQNQDITNSAQSQKENLVRGIK